MLLDELKELIKENKPEVDVSSVTPETRLIEDLNFDSLSMMMLAMDLEDRFGVSFDEDTLEFRTVQDVLNYIESKKK